MCGIAGIYNYHSPAEFFPEISIKKMLSVIRHRGPDESGIYLGKDKDMAIGSVRLSIIDIASGQQPMCDESGNFWIVYNGEIFNYEELRQHLEKRGIHLKSQSDTEVVVQMYAIYGANCLQYFNGQFAFCIWNKKNKDFFLARDRVGIRPLFYWAQNNAFAFCSEIKGLFTLEKVKKSICVESLAQVFTCWTTISPNTPFEDIYELPPAHYMHVSSSGTKIEKYWSLNFSQSTENNHQSLPETVEQFTELLKDAVKIRLKADVPVGAYLSGGLDSTVTTALIHEIDPEVLNTFSIGFKDKAFDESSFQAQASAYFNTKHTAFECTPQEIADQFANTIWHTEFPILRTAPTPMFMLSKKVHEQNIKVVITGEGADEFLGGYNIFKEAKIRRFWANDPKSTIRPKLLSRLYNYVPVMKDANNMAAKMFFGYKLTDTGNPLYSHLLRWHNTSRIKAFFSDEVHQSLNGYNPLDTIYSMLPDQFVKWSDLGKAQYLEATIFMSGYLLSSQGDRAAMGNSVEGRYPFLDYRLIEFCGKLKDSLKLNGLNEKFLLKKMSVGKIPESITKRTKQPYRAPIAACFLSNTAPGYVSEMLSENKLKDIGLFNPAKVKSLLSRLQTQTTISEVDQMAVCGILSSQLLQNMFVANSIIPSLKNVDNIKIIQEN